MPLFILSCLDRTDAPGVRAANRDDHLAYIGDFTAMIRLAGPLFGDEGEMIGSLYVMAAQSRPEVEAFTAGDPYAQAGLFQRVEILPWKVTVNRLFD